MTNTAKKRKVRSRQAPAKRTSHHGGVRDPEPFDPTPMEIPMSACKPDSLHDKIARYVGQAMAAQSETELESFDEANDFEPEDENLLDMSPYELTELEPDAPGFELEDLTKPLKGEEELDEPEPPPDADRPVSAQDEPSGSSGS